MDPIITPEELTGSTLGIVQDQRPAMVMKGRDLKNYFENLPKTKRIKNVGKLRVFVADLKKSAKGMGQRQKTRDGILLHRLIVTIFPTHVRLELHRYFDKVQLYVPRSDILDPMVLTDDHPDLQQFVCELLNDLHTKLKLEERHEIVQERDIKSKGGARAKA